MVAATDCPYQMFDLFSEEWRPYNESLRNRTSAYTEYVCRYSAYSENRNRSDAIEGHLVLLFSGFGFVGGLLTVLTLTQSGFRILNFRLFLLIGYLEMLQMAVLALMDGLAYVRCDASYLCTFLWAHVGITIMNVCADATDLLVLFLCVERTVACLLPHRFQKVHNVRCYKMAVAFAVVLPTAFSLFQAFELTVEFDEDQKRYLDEPSEFSQTELYAYIKQVNTIRFYVTASLVAIMTGLSIWGFWTVAHRRRKLIKNRSTYVPEAASSNSTKESVEHSGYSSAIGVRHLSSRVSRANRKSNKANRSHRQTELCCLQLCLAVPVVINHILYATGLSSNSAFVVGEAALKKIQLEEMTFEAAAREIDLAESFQYLRAATNVSNVMAHALHFYLYIMFSEKVRNGFFSFLSACCRKKPLYPRGMSPTQAETSHIIAPSSIINTS